MNMDSTSFTKLECKYKYVTEGENVTVGKLNFAYFIGHTAGGTCYLVEDRDLVVIPYLRVIGRTDL